MKKISLFVTKRGVSTFMFPAKEEIKTAEMKVQKDANKTDYINQ